MRNRDKGNGLIIIQRRKGKNKNYITVPDSELSLTGIEMQLFTLFLADIHLHQVDNNTEKAGQSTPISPPLLPVVIMGLAQAPMFLKEDMKLLQISPGHSDPKDAFLVCVNHWDSLFSDHLQNSAQLHAK